MGLNPGTRLGPYEILSAIGAGGMGEVYRARDTRLDRDIAIKILPEAFAADAERVARFQREAKVLASLNHPNIAIIHGLEHADAAHALVMELVEGEDLAQRIVRGAIPLDDALPIAKQIAEALEAAHEHGVIHRDLKPANIKLRPDGTVKVLDFGLAKAFAPDAASATAGDLSQSPTVTSPAATRMGVIMGTVAYMAPEQARGKAVDKRADVWAFGCVLYEMLTGRRAFVGEDVSETLAAVLRGEPDWTALPQKTPAPIRRLLRRCLIKDAKRRIGDASIARIEIDEVENGPHIDGEVVQNTSRRRERIAWVSALVLVTFIAAAAAMAWMGAFASPVMSPPETRLEITTPSTPDPISFAISPDGRRLVFVASGDGQPRLWLRPLEAVIAQPLAGTEGAAYPFWSPDSRSIGFFAGSKLKRVDIGGGLPQVLADAAARGGTWNQDGVILFAPSINSPLFRVPASGGEAVAVTKIDRQTSHRFPYFLPGGRQFMFYAQGTPQTGGIYLGSLDSPEARRLTAADTAGAYAPPGWLLFVRQGTLVAQPVDVALGALTGDQLTLADSVGFNGGLSVGAFSISTEGLVAYRSGRANRRQLVWFDRSGTLLGTVGEPDENALNSPRLSPDGRRVGVWRVVEGNADVWLLDAARAARFTFDASLERYPIWSPDGRSIVFDSTRKGHSDLYQEPSSGAGAVELLAESPQDKTALDWSPDGRFLLFRSSDPQTGYDLWIQPMEGHRPSTRSASSGSTVGPMTAEGRKSFVFLKTSFDERHGRFSPDGRWVAYISNESGRHEIHVRPFPGPGGQWQVSTAGGSQPRWSLDGRELYYVAPDATLMAAPIAVNGATFEPGAPVALFHTRIYGGGDPDIGIGWQYDVARDGRFLINVTADEATASPITVILNWTAGLKK